jgi:hypothetical protein
MIFKPRKFRNLKTLINMKFTLAIAFGFMATAYGFRVKTTQDDSCTENIYEEGGCNFVDTFCDPGDGTMSTTSIGTCLNGNTTSSTCDHKFDSNEDSRHCETTACEADATVCDVCTDDLNGNNSDGKQDQYYSSNCTYANGTIVGKLAYFIYHCISLRPFY